MSHKKQRRLQVRAKMKGLYEATRRLCNEGLRKAGMATGKKGKLLTKEGEVKVKWQEHFTEVLNRPVPEAATEAEEADAFRITAST